MDRESGSLAGTLRSYLAFLALRGAGPQRDWSPSPGGGQCLPGPPRASRASMVPCTQNGLTVCLLLMIFRRSQCRAPLSPSPFTMAGTEGAP